MAKFARKDIQINVDGGSVEVEILCFFAHHVRFIAELFDDKGNNPQTVHTGSSLNSDPPPFIINVIPTQLVNRFLMITADVFNLGTSDNFKMEAVFRQRGAEIDRIVLEGTFTDNVTLSIVARFQ